jgi:sigma-B regulation protein RsbU (phosphoserine phosphatase)
MKALHATLQRQLRRAGLEGDAAPSDPEAWAQLLGQIDAHYAHIEDDRAMLSRSLEVSTEEMLGLQAAMQHEREQLRGLLQSVAAVFEEIQSAGDEQGEAGWAHTTALTRAQRRLSLSIAAALTALEGQRGSDPEALHTLRQSFSAFSDRLGGLLNQTSRQARLQRELESARFVQRNLLPPEPEEATSLDIRGYSESAAPCGGDWWFQYPLSETRTLVLIGDVTGHGVPAAILTAAVRGACDMLCALQGEQLRLSHLMEQLNGLISALGQGQLMMSACVVLLDQRRRELRIINAGHPFPLLVRQGKVHTVLGNGSPLGMSQENAFAVGRATFEAGDMLVLYTDGVTEAENTLGEAFSDKRLRRAIAERSGTSAAELRDEVLAQLRRFAGERQEDDITLVVIHSIA